jgi:hypothetical protein
LALFDGVVARRVVDLARTERRRQSLLPAIGAGIRGSDPSEMGRGLIVGNAVG